ncbi:MAG: hypothetical protein RI895_656 [Actinomycetota bacterium]|jgi:hypothetical protein
MTFYEVFINGEEISAVSYGMENLFAVTDYLDSQAKAGCLGEEISSVYIYDTVTISGTQLSAILKFLSGKFSFQLNGEGHQVSEPLQLIPSVKPDGKYEVYLSDV